MIPKQIIILIYVIVIIVILFNSFLKNEENNISKENKIKELFDTAETYFPPKYSSYSDESYVQYSKDYSHFKLKLSGGFFKLKSEDESLSNYGSITIQLTSIDYRGTPFDTEYNIKNCFRKWAYFKRDNKIYKMVLPENEDIIEIVASKGDEVVAEKSKPEPKPKPKKRGYCTYRTFPNDVMACVREKSESSCNSKKIGLNPSPCRWVNESGFQNKEDIIENFNSTLAVQFRFKSILDDEPISIKGEIILSELQFYTGPYDTINNYTADQANEYASGLVSSLGALNNGVSCGWHHDTNTGKAAGYFSEILNDPSWQKDNAELYRTLSRYICPSYLPVCTGQRRTGIVAGKCISLKKNCNNRVYDSILGIEKPSWEKSSLISDEERKYSNLIQKNRENRKALNSVIRKFTDVLAEPSIETFENQDENVEEPSCNFKIENKCYDQYVDIDKKYYEIGADTFNSVFPTTDPNILLKNCNDITKWISDNIVYIFFYKVIVGTVAILLYWFSNPHLDFQIRVFKTFIAFIFSEIYIIYNIYKHIFKPVIKIEN